MGAADWCFFLGAVQSVPGSRPSCRVAVQSELCFRSTKATFGLVAAHALRLKRSTLPCSLPLLAICSNRTLKLQARSDVAHRFRQAFLPAVDGDSLSPWNSLRFVLSASYRREHEDSAAGLQACPAGRCNHVSFLGFGVKVLYRASPRHLCLIP